MITTRAEQIKLALEYEKKTQEAHNKFNEISSLLADAQSKRDVALKQNNELLESNKKLVAEIESGRDMLIGINEQVDIAERKVKYLDKQIQDSDGEIGNLENKIIELTNKKIDAQVDYLREYNKLEELKIKNQEYEKFNESLERAKAEMEQQIAEQKNRHNKKEVEMVEVVEKLEKEIKKNTEEKVKIEEAKNLLNKYVEKLNKYYEENNINININIWQE